MARATEAQWLKWFYQHADFGPGQGDVMVEMIAAFKEETGKDVPKGYDYE